MINLNKSVQYISENRQETIQALLNFLPCDVLLFWSENEELCKLQQEQWFPLLQKLKQDFSLNFKTTCSLDIPDNVEVTNLFANMLNDMSETELTVCMLCAERLKSVISGFMVAKKQISAEQAFQVANLEEYYQTNYWGIDVTAEKMRQQIKVELLQIEEYYYGKMS